MPDEPNEPNEFMALIQRMVKGDKQATVELYDRYRETLIHIIRSQLNRTPQLRTTNDTLDILQDTWQEVFTHPEKLYDNATFEQFTKHLTGIISRKIKQAKRKNAAKKRDRRRVRHLSDPGVAAAAAAVADPRPSPDEEAASFDLWFHWLKSLTPRQRHVACLLKLGHTYRQTAARLRCSERSIERIVAELRDTSPPVPMPYL